MGSALLRRLLSEPGLAGVLAPTRREVRDLEARPRVSAPRVDFRDLEAGLAGARADQAFVCLGTTMATAKSEEAFRRVDHDAVVAASRASLTVGARDLLLVSSVGASRWARSFYLRVKGETEEEVMALPFRSIQVFRPSLLKGRRRDSRPIERLGMGLGTLVSPVMLGPLRRYRPIPAETVAAAMVAAARAPVPGRRIHESEQIVALAGR